MFVYLEGAGLIDGIALAVNGHLVAFSFLLDLHVQCIERKVRRRALEPLHENRADSFDFEEKKVCRWDDDQSKKTVRL